MIFYFSITQSFLKKSCVLFFLIEILGFIVKIFFTALQNIPAESIDLIFADPPYNLSNGFLVTLAKELASTKENGIKVKE